MENLHLKNLKNLTHISEIYLNKAKDIFNLQTKVLEYTSQITMKNPQLELFKNEFIKYFRDYDYTCRNEQGSFLTFTRIITELQNVDIGTDISKTFIINDNEDDLYFIFIHAPHQSILPNKFSYIILNIQFILENGIIKDIIVKTN